jgi:hypothetical protein
MKSITAESKTANKMYERLNIRLKIVEAATLPSRKVELSFCYLVTKLPVFLGSLDLASSLRRYDPAVS